MCVDEVVELVLICARCGETDYCNLICVLLLAWPFFCLVASFSDVTFIVEDKPVYAR